ncbi:phosphocholine cytidylyltransferase family protein [Altericroceibacterium spongiae]|uniref:Phosphocholine cytidylyltransferase family protein n=1 Tax=Altericroceibacterium spongiae TaxID=2320269 RepID=A0A420EAJ0_9SPHN|nr:NTP transferase domain-containing protein [Altericroceibacterium spongiae]RKF17672.1 phosphocholine cytidylyltransferase family protein [Altericroceibacterium spongiae]
MKAVILSAGHGSRLLPLTLHTPKCLVPVDGRELLLHQLLALRETGIEEAVLVVGYRHEQIEAFVQQELPVRVTTLFNPFWSIANSIGSVWAARMHLDTPFCLMNGDTLFDRVVLTDSFRRLQAGVSLLVEPCGTPETDDMRVHVEQGQVQQVSKVLPDSLTTHRSLGVIVSNGGTSYRDALDAVIQQDGGPANYHHAIIAHLAQQDHVAAISRGQGDWQEIDRPDDISRWQRRHGEGA